MKSPDAAYKGSAIGKPHRNDGGFTFEFSVIGHWARHGEYGFTDPTLTEGRNKQ
jgi:hypothetical protein